jgi:nicotinic acid mononucleotide adenylyltransferase
MEGFLKDHVELNGSMKLYFLLGKDLVNGLVFLHDDGGCVKLGDYVCSGGGADAYIEFYLQSLFDNRLRILIRLEIRYFKIQTTGVEDRLLLNI